MDFSKIISVLAFYITKSIAKLGHQLGWKWRLLLHTTPFIFSKYFKNNGVLSAHTANAKLPAMSILFGGGGGRISVSPLLLTLPSKCTDLAGGIFLMFRLALSCSISAIIQNVWVYIVCSIMLIIMVN